MKANGIRAVEHKFAKNASMLGCQKKFPNYKIRQVLDSYTVGLAGVKHLHDFRCAINEKGFVVWYLHQYPFQLWLAVNNMSFGSGNALIPLNDLTSSIYTTLFIPKDSKTRKKLQLMCTPWREGVIHCRNGAAAQVRGGSCLKCGYTQTIRKCLHFLMDKTKVVFGGWKYFCYL